MSIEPAERGDQQAPGRGIHVRPFEERDRVPLIGLWRAVFPDDPVRNEPMRLIDQKLRVQPELLLVAEKAGELVGAVMAGFDGTRGWVHHLAVRPGDRRQGIARKLVRAAELGLVSLGCPKVNLQVRATNPGVVEFYRRLGYEIEDRVSMGKVLGSRGPAGSFG